MRRRVEVLVPLNVLVTGGAGYIGSHTVRALAAAGYTPIVYDNLTRGHRPAVADHLFIEGDLADRRLLRQVLETHEIEAVLHFAALSLVGESVRKPAQYFRNNVCGTLNLLDAMVAAGATYLVFSSTAAIYGEPQEIPITENHPQNPTNPYGESKLFVEKILRRYDAAYGLKSISLRYFNAAGADPSGSVGEDHDPETHLIPVVLQVALGQRPCVRIFGTDYETCDGTCVRDYIHVNDLAEAHVLALKSLVEAGNSAAYNLGNGAGFSVREVIQTCEEVVGKPIPSQPAPRRPGDPAVLVASSRRAMKELGWRPRFNDLRTIVATAWQWHKNHPDGYGRGGVVTSP